MGIFNRFKNHKKEKEEDFSQVNQERLQEIANKTYPGLAMYARDVNLSSKLENIYKPGMIIHERGITDATDRFMGMVTTHRYVILSNHMADLSSFEHGTNWSLHVANKDSHFKVLGIDKFDDKTAIFLLHLPDDEDWKLWKTMAFSVDEQLYQMAIERFKEKCNAEIIPELAKQDWLDRCAFPLGMDDQGNLFKL